MTWSLNLRHWRDHLVDLRKLFLRLRKFKLRLNRSKYVFAIRDMPVLKTEKEVRGLEGQLHRLIHSSINNHVWIVVQTAEEKCQDGMGWGLSKSVRQDKGLSAHAPSFGTTNPRAFLDLILVSGRNLYGLCIGTIWQIREKGVGDLFSKQEVHKLWE